LLSRDLAGFVPSLAIILTSCFSCLTINVHFENEITASVVYKKATAIATPKAFREVLRIAKSASSSHVLMQRVEGGKMVFGNLFSFSLFSCGLVGILMASLAALAYLRNRHKISTRTGILIIVAVLVLALIGLSVAEN
jgi:hypothetical protein